MAAYYPDRPDALHRVQARRFFDALGLLYPCTHCAQDFREDMRRGGGRSLTLFLLPSSLNPKP